MRALPNLCAATPAAAGVGVELVGTSDRARAERCAADVNGHIVPRPARVPSFHGPAREGAEAGTPFGRARELADVSGSYRKRCSPRLTRWPMTSTPRRYIPREQSPLMAVPPGRGAGGGWIHAYRGKSADAIEQFQIARNLAPCRPVQFSHLAWHRLSTFEASVMKKLFHWYRRTLSEQPEALWVNRFLTAGLALAGHKEEAKRSLAMLTGAFPALTIAQFRSGLPHTISLIDRVSDGLRAPACGSADRPRL